MDESWEKAMESALEGHAESSSSSSSPRTLTLDGAVKCLHGRLPPPSLLERFRHLEHLSIANIGLSSLESFPKLRSLQRLSLSDNRIAGGLEFLVESGLDSLRDLDLSNNRIQSVEDLAPLANLRLISLDLYECPVTRVKDYRSRVFGMIPSLKYLDKMDADGNERPESDDEEEEEEEEEYDEEEIDGEDPGNSEIDGEDQAKTVNGSGAVGNGDVDEDEDEESDADEEETETGRNGMIHHSNGFHVAAVGDRRDDDEEDVDEEDGDDDYEEEDEDLGEGEEINEDEDGEEEDVVEAQDVLDSDEEDRGDGVEEGDGREDEDEDEDDVEDEAEGEPGSTDRLVSTEGEIDGHEQGEDDDDENAGEIGEADDDQGLGEDRDSEEDGESEDEEEDLDGEFLVQPIPQQERTGDRGGRSEIDACNEEDEDEVDDTEQYRLSNVVALPQPSSPLQPNKRRRDEDGDDSVDKGLRSSKHH